MPLIAGHKLTLFITDETDTLIELAGITSLTIELIQRAAESKAIATSPWRTLLPESGSASLRISANGMFCSDHAEDTLRTHAFNATNATMQCHFGNGDSLSGDFIITRFSRTGENNHNPASISFSAESTGNIIYS
jgi:predicted secreted protein